MDKKFEIRQNLENKLILSPSLILSMNILNLNNLELLDFLKKKEEENPFVVVEENTEVILKNNNLSSESLKNSYIDDIENFNYFSSNFSSSTSTTDVIEDIVKEEDTIVDKLKDYLDYYNIDEKIKTIVVSLLFYLNNNGIFIKNEDEILKELEIDNFEFENCKVILQNFENKGLGSSNLKELFLVQLNLSNFENSDLYYNFIKNYWDEFINLKYNYLEKKGYNRDFINKLIIDLKSIIDLYPLSNLLDSNPEYIVPDIIINYNVEDFSIKLNNFFKLKHINIDFKDLNNELKEKYKEYENIKTSLNLRENILKSFIEYFILYQQKFLKKGIKYVKMISQKGFADKIGISYSTLSRIISKRYIQTDYGIFPLKFFFQTVKDKRNKKSKEYSKNEIIEKIREIISNESNNTLTDEEIARKLKEYGINIARRTVAKYRSELNILPANLRKKSKN